MSPKLPVITSKQLIRALKRAGFIIDHQKGSHVYLSHPDTSARTVPVPYHNVDLKKGTLSNILKIAGLTKEELRELL
ncbi:MAG: type II toxin-antitoxin system HicA family toxin [Calditrichaeota bacterium]|nr:type II toxin-antitoxin system HicA family toxin [Calditrichota bacterium]